MLFLKELVKFIFYSIVYKFSSDTLNFKIIFCFVSYVIEYAKKRVLEGGGAGRVWPVIVIAVTVAVVDFHGILSKKF